MAPNKSKFKEDISLDSNKDLFKSAPSSWFLFEFCFFAHYCGHYKKLTILIITSLKYPPNSLYNRKRICKYIR